MESQTRPGLSVLALLGTWIQLKAAVTLDQSDYEYCKLKLMLTWNRQLTLYFCLFFKMKSSFCLNVRIHYWAKLHFSTILFSCRKVTYMHTYFICHKVSAIEQLALRWHTGTVALLMKAKIVNVIIVFNFDTILRRCNYSTLTLAGELMW